MEVSPIRNKSQIEEMKVELLKSSYRNYLMFMFGLNTGLRISDIVALKVEDVKDRNHITIKEKKTDKTKKFVMNKSLKTEVNKYIQNMNDEDYLFKSRQGGNNPITTVQAYRALKKVADKVEIEDFGTHSMRKSFGYFHYKKFNDVAILQKIFNHSAPSITLKYIGITQEEIDNTMMDFEL